jgi:GAF domain-containing protein
MSEPIRVLLVDDEESFRKPMMERLIERGFQVEEAVGGPEALAKARDCGGNYHVAVIDQLMGPPNGIETMRQLHQLYPAIEVIVLTGWGDMEPGEKAMEMGAYRYMSKPVSNVEELVLNIKTASRFGQERQRGLALQALIRAGQQISGLQSEDDLYQRIYEQAQALLPSLDSFLVSLWDEPNQTVSFPFCHVRGERQPPFTRQGYKGITEFVIQSKKPLLLMEGDEVFRRKHGLQLPQIDGNSVSEIAVPMFAEDKVVGTINALTCQPDVRYTSKHLAVLQALANQAAVTIQNVRHLEEAKIWQELDRKIATCSSPKTAYQLFAKQAQRALHADFAVLYPYDPTAPPNEPRFILKHCVQVGDLRKPWQLPQGGLEGGVHKALEKASDGLLIVNDLEGMRGRLRTHLSEREEIKAFIALRLEVVPEGQTESRTAGMLFLNLRKRTAFEPADLVGLQLAGSRVAAAIQRLHLLAVLKKERQQLNRRLGAVVDIFQAFRERRDRRLILEGIAGEMKEALDIDVCTLLEYDPKKEKFSERGVAGLKIPEAHYTLPSEFKRWFLDKPSYTVILDVQQNEQMRDRDFVRREGIQSTIVYPLRVEGESLGLLFASYRYHKEPTPDEEKAIGLFADLAALVLCETRLREELSQTQKRLERRLFLDWMSMIETTWRHSQIQTAAAIRNHTAILQRRLARRTTVPSAMNGLFETVSEIDRLAEKIAAAPPRVPQSWEMEAELFPLAPLLEEVAQRETKSFSLRAGPPMEIIAKVEALGGVQVRGYRRWLIYALEALLQNARNAMFQGGTVTITGQRAGARAEIRIQDTGSGVPEAIRCKLFKELVKEQDRAGMGIGALLAATIIEEHEGSIELEKPGPGDTTVLISLPVAEEAEL